ncbi:mechanosensitive ion channel [Candidatus Fermentibacteria bacterium]|nr:mechanosensitive ion channel [Candidatus Fermentibacteria bacterium]
MGLGAGVILRLLRNLAPGRKLAFWLFLTAGAAGAYLIASASGIPTGTFWMNVFFSAVILLAVNSLLQLVNAVVWEYLLKQKRGINLPRLVIDVVNFAVLAAAALALLRTVFAVNLNAFLVTSTVVSAVVGLSLQDVLGSVVAGMALQMEKPFAVGDWIRLSGEEEGQLVQMSWRTLTVRTRDNHTLILPNSTVTKQSITNLSRSKPFLIRLNVGFAYKHPPGEVRRVMLEAVRESGVAREEPAPSVLLKSYGDFSIEYEIRFWCDDYGRKPQLMDAVMSRIWYSAKRAGIEIPFPVRDVTVKTLPEDFEEQKETRLRDGIFRDLRSVGLFEGLSDDQLRQVASTSSVLRFTEGEHLFHQGDFGDSMYIVKSGEVRVMVRRARGDYEIVARIGQGGFFGEMSLLTGEPRTASVIADTETEVIVLSKHDFSTIISSDEGVVEALSKTLSERMQALTERSARADEASRAVRAPQRADLIRRIRSFFGL